MQKALRKNRPQNASELLNEAPPLFRLPDVIPELVSAGNSLPSPEIHSVSVPSSGHNAEIKILLPDTGRRVNLYLLKNNKPVDMFFNVIPGIYKFTISSLHSTAEALNVVYVAGRQISERIPVLRKGLLWPIDKSSKNIL